MFMEGHLIAWNALNIAPCDEKILTRLEGLNSMVSDLANVG